MQIREPTGTLECGGYHERKRPRTKLEILADILLVARTGATKTEIVYQTNLNFGRTGGYLTYLEDKGLLENSGPIYTSTERGKAFARDFQLMNEVLRS